MARWAEVPVDPAIAAWHKKEGGKWIKNYIVDLTPTLYLFVVFGMEPFNEDGSFGRHISVAVKHKETNELVRLPVAKEILQVMTALGLDVARFELQGDHLWEKK